MHFPGIWGIRSGMFNRIDHLAILVGDTDQALTLYRDTLGLPLILTEVLDEVGVRLTHLDAGNIKIQLVEPLTPDHPLRRQLEERGEGLHHLCWAVDDVQKAMAALPDRNLQPRPNEPHPAPRGGSAAFIDPAGTGGVLMEMTSPNPE